MTMNGRGTAAAGATLTVVQPGEGSSGGLAPGIGVQFKISAEATGGALSIVEHPFAVGALVPPHVHTLEDEISIVLEGQIGFRSSDQEVVLAPGGYVVKPRGEVHAMWNAGPTPARMIEVITPAGFERFFADLTRLTAVGRPDPDQVAALADQYGLPFAEPDWLPDVIARYGLTPLRR
jgi:quercetin dioxygenase-like cupin family protein